MNTSTISGFLDAPNRYAWMKAEQNDPPRASRNELGEDRE